MKLQNKSLSVLIISVILLIVLSYFVSAFGVVSTYTLDNPLTLYPGQTTETSFIIQNNIGDSDLTIQADLVGGADIATLTDNNLQYDVPLGSQVKVDVKIEIPENAQIGKEYVVEGLFTPVSPEVGDIGAVQLVNEISKSFAVVVAEQTEVQEVEIEKNANFLLWILGILIILLIVWYIIRKIGKKKEG